MGRDWQCCPSGFAFGVAVYLAVFRLFLLTSRLPCKGGVVFSWLFWAKYHATAGDSGRSNKRGLNHFDQP
ncbi:hypothetical protein GQ53DRAFT_750134 [Thozetella sp. PMI_491]|nr:hypothetical protein GQ53DRAFT_750134 [Thozetella sp. PMI_491]